MKIAHITCVYPPYGGGIGKACFEQAKQLARLGHQVTVFTPRYDQKTEAIELPGVEVKLIKPFFKIGKAGALISLFWQLRKFDLVQLHYPFFFTDKIVWLLKLIGPKKFKLVLYYHMDVKSSGLKGLVFKIYNRFLRKRILKIADLILVSSFDYIENSDIKEYFLNNKNKFRELPLGVDVDVFQPKEKSQSLMGEHNLKTDDQIILFVGGLDKNHYFKGIPILLLALNKIKHEHHRQPKLLIVGSGDLLEGYKKMAQDLNLIDQVIFAGHVSDKELPRYYNLADVFVLPSIDSSEAFGMVLLEAMACSKPCLASDLAGVRTVVTDYQTGLLVKPRDIDDLAQKLDYILVHHKQREKMGEQSRKKVIQKYDWQKLGKKLESFYIDIN